MRVPTATRLQAVEEYYFSKKLEEIRHLEAEGHQVINLGIGSPDLPPAPEVIEVLHSTAEDPSNHAYQSYRGLPQLRQSITDFLECQFNETFDSVTEVLPLMGSKEGITHISLAFLDKGDEVLIPSLGYPTYTSVTKMMEAKPVYFPLLEDSNWEPDWDFLDQLDTSSVKLMWINYPHMPTGQKGSKELFSRLVAYAQERNLLLCHDNPYSFILNDQPLSIFQVPGAREVAVELNSLSKTINMAGWRVGWVAGNATYINAILQIKSNMDSGMFKPVQLAACKALSLTASWYENLNAIYKQRQVLAYRLLDELNCSYDKSTAGMFIWAKVPEGKTGQELADVLLNQFHIFLTPGFIFGDAGNRYIRISLCASEATFQEAIDRLNV